MKKQAKNLPCITVCIITYNQEFYISNCINSIINQRTYCDIEIIIGDDYSTDDTRKILIEYQNKYPQIIRLILHEQKVGAQNNYLAVHRAAKGLYVCHVDGDDLCRPNKLAEQKNYLDRYPECPLVAHRAGIWVLNKQISTTKKNPNKISLKMLLLTHPIFIHSSIMYRRTMLSNIFAENRNFIDFYFYIAAAKISEIGFINQVLGDYNSNIGFSRKKDLMHLIQEAISSVGENLIEFRYVSRSRAKQYLSYAIAFLIEKDFNNFKFYLLQSRRADKKWLASYLIDMCSVNINILLKFIKIYKMLRRKI